jgi:hypothetical protein
MYRGGGKEKKKEKKKKRKERESVRAKGDRGDMLIFLIF